MGGERVPDGSLRFYRASSGDRVRSPRYLENEERDELMKRREMGRYNPKRQILPADHWSPDDRAKRAAEASYGGNAEHKTRPGNYGLKPPCNPRPGKTLCDQDRDFPLEEAQALLRSGLSRGLVSEQRRNGWPQNVWAVAATGEVFEGQLENQGNGTYHGYPMPAEDDFREVVREEWRRREP